MDTETLVIAKVRTRRRPAYSAGGKIVGIVSRLLRR